MPTSRWNPNGKEPCTWSGRRVLYQVVLFDRFRPLRSDCCDNRQALRYMIRNTTLPQRVRAQAQLQLSQMHPYTRPTQIKNRCVASGTARSVFRDFRINRVSGLPWMWM